MIHVEDYTRLQSYKKLFEVDDVCCLAVVHLVPKVGVLWRAAAGENTTDLVWEEAVT